MSQSNILMLMASLGLSGTPRILMDLVKGLIGKRGTYRLHIAYKPEFPGPGNELVEDIKNLGVELHPLRGKHLFSPSGMADLLKILRDRRIDIIHCWDELSFAARFLSRFVGSRVIDSIGNPPADENVKTRCAKALSSLFLDGIIFQSFGSREAHFSNGSNILRWCKNAVIYNAVDPVCFPRFSHSQKGNIRQKFGVRRDHLVLTNLGMYNQQKAQEYLIKALPFILARDISIRMLLLGWGEREALLRKAITKLGLEDHVLLTGKKQRDEVFEILSITDIYVSSSLWEGLPVALLEAMAFGIPIVATNVIGNNEAVVNGKTGFLVQPRDLKTFADAVTELALNPLKRNEMGYRARKRIHDCFGIKRFIKEHEEFYRMVLNR